MISFLRRVLSPIVGAHWYCCRDTEKTAIGCYCPDGCKCGCPATCPDCF